MRKEGVIVSMPAAVSHKSYKGVKGWLFILCILMVALIPGKSLFYLVGLFAKYSTFFPAYPGPAIATVGFTVVAVGVMSFSIYAGTGLWAIRSGAVRVAKISLLSIAGCSLLEVSLLMLFPLLAGLPWRRVTPIIPAVLKEFLQQTILIAIWYVYLCTSKRVRDTYGVNHG